MLLKHPSIKNLDPNYEIDSKLLDEMKDYISNAPTSLHSQQLSIIEIKDKAIRNKLYEPFSKMHQEHIRDSSSFFVFIIDLNKPNIAIKSKNKEMKIQNSVESIVAGSIDVGISLAYARIFAAQNGLQTCPIGFLRSVPDLVIDLLELPKYTFPVVGLAIGKPLGKVPLNKRRLNINSLFHENKYSNDSVNKAVNYDINNPDNWDYAEVMASMYTRNYAPNVYKALKRQGFEIKE